MSSFGFSSSPRPASSVFTFSSPSFAPPVYIAIPRAAFLKDIQEITIRDVNGNTSTLIYPDLHPFSFPRSPITSRRTESEQPRVVQNPEPEAPPKFVFSAAAPPAPVDDPVPSSFGFAPFSRPNFGKIPADPAADVAKPVLPSFGAFGDPNLKDGEHAFASFGVSEPKIVNPEFASFGTFGAPSFGGAFGSVAPKHDTQSELPDKLKRVLEETIANNQDAKITITITTPKRKMENAECPNAPKKKLVRINL